MKTKTLDRYFPDKIEPKWQQKWKETKLYDFEENPKKQKYYTLVELPYPSGDLHIGHWFTFAAADVLSRFKRMTGVNVFFPNGYDAFGLPAENAAIKRSIHPKDWTMSNIASMTKQFETMGTMIDWRSLAITCLPEYYRWNQWIFQQMYKKGIAYRSKTLSNWCPVDQTVLANEHVEDGKCWRCGSEVEQKPVEQWFLKITAYADELLWSEPSKQKKTAVIIHGVSGHSEENWFPWLKKELEGKGWKVLVPDLPSADHPKPKEWHEALVKLTKNVEGGLTVVAHSLGGPAALRLAEELGHKIEKLVLVAPVNPHMQWDKLKKDYPDLDWDGVQSFTLEKIDLNQIQAQVDKTVIIYSDTDPYVDPASITYYKRQFSQATFIEMKGKGHFNASAGMTTFPELLEQFPDATGLPNGVNWPQSVREGQNNWIGRSEGLIFTAPVKDSAMKIQTFSAHFEAFTADTFVVIAPDHPLLEELVKDVPDKKEILAAAKKMVQDRTQNRNKEGKTIDGVFTGKYIIDPVGNGDLPIWIASFALRDYGTGIVKCSAHDERDFAFAKKYGIRLKPVLFPKDEKLRKQVENLDVCYTDMKNGILAEPAAFAGRKAGDVRQKIIQYVQEKGYAKPVTQYHLHDWSVSRQRYWGTPVPMIDCETCGIVPVPEKDLPVELPYDVDYMPKGKPPLASNEEWLHTTCPKCGGKATRDPETLDTFFDSSWYFYRYTNPQYEKGPFDPDRVKTLMPVDIYFGGAEHTLGHTLYARFFTKFFEDLGMIDFSEFAKKRVQHGIVLGTDGNKMSKSKGNVINPDTVVKEYGADAVRLYLSFMMPYEATGPWSTTAMAGTYRFLKRIWELQEKVISDKQEAISREDQYQMHHAIDRVTRDIESIKMNTAVAAVMEWLNYLSRKEQVSSEEYKTLVLLIAPFAPHMAEELWEKLGENYSVHQQDFPKVDAKYLTKDMVKIAVQINGKVRDVVEVSSEKAAAPRDVEEIARESEKVMKHLKGQEIIKTILIPGKIISFVVKS